MARGGICAKLPRARAKGPRACGLDDGTGFFLGDIVQTIDLSETGSLDTKTSPRRFETRPRKYRLAYPFVTGCGYPCEA